MCLIIDTNTLGKVFDKRNAEHSRFAPVMNWVTNGDGTVILGGTKYLEEIGNGRILSLLVELRRVRRAVVIEAKAVDDRAKQLKILVPEKAFNDEHIVALVGLSKCRLVCTDDLESLPYLKRKELYPPGVGVPHIYRKIQDTKHCCARSIVAICPTRSTAMCRPGKKAKSRPKVEAL